MYNQKKEYDNKRRQHRLSKHEHVEDPKQQVKSDKKDKEDYDVLNYEDELDHDTQSLERNDDEDDEITDHLIGDFDLTFQEENYDEVKEVTDKQGLSPRDRKSVR